jgi:hypothetical protein
MLRSESARRQRRQKLQVSQFSQSNTWPTAIHLVASGAVDLDAMVTGHYPLDQVEAALPRRAPTRPSSRPWSRPGDEQHRGRKRSPTHSPEPSDPGSSLAATSGSAAGDIVPRSQPSAVPPRDEVIGLQHTDPVRRRLRTGCVAT